eukprot:Em0010g978a
MDGEEYDCIYSFLETGTYPSAYHKAQKRSLRRKCEDYAVDSGVLYRKKEKERGEMEFLRVPRGVEERERILHSCHSSKESFLRCEQNISSAQTRMKADYDKKKGKPKQQSIPPASPGDPQSTLPASPGEPQSTLPVSPEEHSPPLPASPGEPQSTLPVCPEEHSPPLPASPGEPQSTLPVCPEEHSPPLPASSGEPQFTLPVSPEEPQSTSPAFSPQLTQPIAPQESTPEQNDFYTSPEDRILFCHFKNEIDRLKSELTAIVQGVRSSELHRIYWYGTKQEKAALRHGCDYKPITVLPEHVVSDPAASS